MQAILTNPGEAGKVLESDLAAGGSPAVVFGLLEAAESVVRLRGLDLTAQLRGVRTRLERFLKR